ncbi:MAG: TonB-dependent receptor, partial [Paucibacter sp.]|nr:TonB-dependent receptor [Roseateles sp.]
MTSRPASPQTPRFTCRRTLLSLASLAALSTLAAGAQAQSAPPPAAPAAEQPAKANLDTVTVTGLRASLESALRAKRDDNSIVDVIKAEDMGKFPDTNLAE